MPPLPQLSLPVDFNTPSFSFIDDNCPELPSLPSTGLSWDNARELFSDRITDIAAAASSGASSVKQHPAMVSVSAAVSKGATWVQEHPEEAKNVGLVSAAAVVLLLTLYALHPWIFAILGAVYNIMAGVLKLISLAVKAILLWTLHLVGFTAEGVRLGSTAAFAQSAVYGGFTRGIFSILQAAGVLLRV